MTVKRLTILGVGTAFLFAALHCAKPTQKLEGDLFSEQALAVVLSAALVMSNTGSLSAERRVPPAKGPLLDRIWEAWIPQAWAALNDCPSFDSAVCRRQTDEGITDIYDTGEYLLTFRDRCFEARASERGTWRSYVAIKFPASASYTATENCEAARSTLTTGITPAFLTARGLYNKTLRTTYGRGRHGDQQNFMVDENMILRAIYTDFVSGGYEVEPTKAGERGGIELTYTKSGTLDRTVRIPGMQIKGLKRFNTDENTTPEAYLNAFMTDPSIAFTIWDRTFATEDKGDRKYESSDAADDATSDSGSFTIKEASGARTIESGVLRIQNNFVGEKVTFGRAEVTESLNFSDANCNCPATGKIVTKFSGLSTFQLPGSGQYRYDEERINFVRGAGGTCGDATISRYKDGEIKLNEATVNLAICR